MATKERENEGLDTEGLDVEMFKKRVAHFDNANVNERGNAIRQALKQCEDAGLRFGDACAVAFGQDGGGDVAELQEALAEKQARIDQLESENGELSEGVTALQEELQGRGGMRRRRGQGFRGLMADAWSFPQFRLLLLAGVIAARMWCFLALESNGASAKLTWWVNRVFVALLVWLLVKWSGLQYEQSGVGPVFMRWMVFGGMAVSSVACFFGGWNWQDWFAPSFVEHIWGKTIVVTGVQHPAIGFVVLLLAVVLVACNFTERVSGKAGNSEFLRSWFL